MSWCASDARANLANLQHRAGELAAAEAAYRFLLQSDAEDTLARVGLGRVLWDVGQQPSALTELARALTRAPRSYDALIALVTARCQACDLAGALQACAAFLAVSPSHSGGLALHAELAFEVGAREQPTSSEYEKLLKTYDFAPPDADLNVDLAAEISSVHPEAWLSGVYYVEVPASVGDATCPRPAGWLELGQVDPTLGLTKERKSHFVRPVAGRLVLFPSYLYHSTIPHRSPGRRISVGIDVIPLR